MEITEHKYLVCLGSEGYEALFDLTGIREEETIARLKGEDTPRLADFHRFLTTMPLRIRMNSHRNIKAYVVETSVEEEEFKDMLCASDILCKSIQEKYEPLEKF